MYNRPNTVNEQGPVPNQRATSATSWSLGRPTVASVVTSLVFLISGVLVPSGAAGAMASAVHCTAPQGRLAVAVVVTFADGTSPTVRCTNIRSGGSGFDALRSAGFSLRIESGFLCAIDGMPATGCANGSGFDGTYWRYFRAQPGGTWQYANTGGGYAIQTSSGCAVEGWTWSGASTITAPTYSPGSITCSHTTTTTSPPPTTSSPTAPSTTRAPVRPPSTGGSGSGATSPGSGTGSSGTIGSGSGVPGSGGSGIGVPGADAGPATGSSDSTTAGRDGPAGAADEESGTGPDASEVTSDGGVGSNVDKGSADGSRDGSDQDEAALSRGGRASSGAPGSGSPTGLIVAGVLILAMMATAVIGNRRRSRPPAT
ncbi:MAG: hypothetical protein KDB26_03290 [Microthrixaceae bacterium]|nr:hypothetical protein [Microthrixaceae bacterium]